jgi:SCY1-like protein 2
MASFHSRAILIQFKVQERALGVVPGLCESIDYAEVQGVLFPRVAVRFSILSDDYLTDTHQLVFTKTRILSVKVATLVTFLSMVKILDQVNMEIFPRSRLG